jgi:tellurite resistance protein TerC
MAPRALELSSLKQKARKIAIGIAGGLVLALGLALLVLPGPAFLVIPLGFAILATEFHWARKWKDRVDERYRHWRSEHRKRKAQKRSQAQAVG